MQARGTGHASVVTDQRRTEGMGLKPPGILTFTVAIILVVIAAASRWAQAHIPIVNGHEFQLALLAFVVLALGCVLRGL